MNQCNDVFPVNSVDITRRLPKRFTAPSAGRDGANLPSLYRRQRSITLDVVCSSHIDTAGKLAVYKPALVEQVSKLSEEEIRKLIVATDLFCAPQRLPVVILNVGRKAAQLWDLIDQSPSKTIKADGEVGLLPARYAFEDFDAFRDLFLSLCITREEIEALLKELGTPLDPGTLIGFSTDWYDFFNVEGTAEFNGIYELWHPFLLHPYLDENALSFLLDNLQVAGIVTDAPTLEPPIYYVGTNRSVVPNVFELKRALATGIKSKHLSLPKDPFLHIRVLTSRRLIVESLDLPKVVPVSSKIVRGELIIVPMFGNAEGSESLPVRAQFVPSALATLPAGGGAK